MPNPYKSLKYPRLTVDSFVLDRRGRLLLVRRGRPPFRGTLGPARRLLRMEGDDRGLLRAGDARRDGADREGGPAARRVFEARPRPARAQRDGALRGAPDRAGKSRAATTRPRPGGSPARSSRGSPSPSTTRRSSGNSWLDGFDRGRRVLLGAGGAAPLEDEHLARGVELLLVLRDDRHDVVDLRRDVNELEVLGVHQAPRTPSPAASSRRAPPTSRRPAPPGAPS